MFRCNLPTIFFSQECHPLMWLSFLACSSQNSSTAGFCTAPWCMGYGRSWWNHQFQQLQELLPADLAMLHGGRKLTAAVFCTKGFTISSSALYASIVLNCDTSLFSNGSWPHGSWFMYIDVLFATISCTTMTQEVDLRSKTFCDSEGGLQYTVLYHCMKVWEWSGTQI